MAWIINTAGKYIILPLFQVRTPQAGRYRQHYQFGCEAIGESSLPGCRVIEMAWQFFSSLD